ncbi:MAG: GldG family protein [Bacteriovoracaceae bacterium]
MKDLMFPLWVIIDILVFLAAVSLWIAAPEHTTLNMSLTFFAFSLGIILGYSKLSEIKIFIRSHYFKKLSYHLINVALIICIIGLINYLGNKNYKEFDLTSQKRNSLTEQSKKVLVMVKSPLKMTIFAKREEWQGMLNLLKLYEAASKNIQLEAVDTDVRPDLVKAHSISQNGTVLIQYNNKESKFIITDELSVTNALLKALREKPLVLYMLSGHQELSCEDTSQEGLSILCEKLNSLNYEVKNLDLVKSNKIPADAAAILILGPTQGYLKQEIDEIEAYLSKGGSLFLALAPAFKADLYDNLVVLGRPFGLELGHDIVIDRLSTVQGAEATIPIVTDYDQDNPITADFNLRTIFPLSASVRTIPGNDNAEILARTSPFPGSWAETDLKGVTEGKAIYNENKDTKGPIGLLGVGEKVIQGIDSRFVLLGSSSFLINAYQGQSGNTILFLNAASWLVNDEGIISFNRPGLEEYPVILSSAHLQMIFVISILLIPIVFFGSAIFVYRRRRLL